MKRAYATTWGAQLLDGAGVRFRLWAPAARSVSVVYTGGAEPQTPMSAAGGGWFECVDRNASAGTRYLYEIDGRLRVADPASRFQPDGPEAASQVVDPAAFDWPESPFALRPYHEAIFYELHVGTFTPEGTYAAASAHLDRLADLGVTAIELMPLSEAPGARNWGYDGVLHYAPSHNYGSPDDLKRFVVAAHERGLAVLLDVVYNHFGPQGNYLPHYASQFFSSRLATPWGAGIDYSSRGNDAVRAYAIDNACYWIVEYGFDGLRLDATSAIYDSRPVHVLHELADRVRNVAARRVYLIAEDVKNEVVDIVATYDGRWSDDAHHALHVVITGERSEYFEHFVDAPLDKLGRALTTEGTHRVDYLQNHDQIGNRPFGERIAALAPADAVRAASAILMLAPPVPLLFMGEEWGAPAPFLFFCDFEPSLARRVTEGRRKEFAGLAEFADASLIAALPDPSATETFLKSKLPWNRIDEPPQRDWLQFFRGVLRVRREKIAPRLAALPANSGRYRLAGNRGLILQWTLQDGGTLKIEANLGTVPQPGFDDAGDVVFATPSGGATGNTLPAWGVRCSLGE